MSRVRPVIMSGGSGTRLWPVSRQLFPKQLLPIAGDRSMLQQTAARFTSAQFAPPIAVTGEEHRHFIKRQLQEIGVTPEAILLEPEPRNTAAVAALAAEWARRNGDDDLLLLLPSDHVILDSAAFLEAVQIGLDQANAGGIVTFGIRPQEPNTQYGYIEASGADGANAVHPVTRFLEKPDAETAGELWQSGRHYWNAGIFMFRPSTLLEELSKHLPGTRDGIASALEQATPDGVFIRPDADAFRKAENISIDYAVMQKTDRAFVVPVDMGWSDVGSWSSLWATSAKDEHNNVVAGDVLAIDTRNSLVRSDGSATIATIGLEDVVVVGTRDAILVAPMGRSDEVKHVVRRLADGGRPCATTPPKVARPWGSFESLDQGDRFRIKHIVVDAGEQISLQKHYHRSEHWVVVRGTAEVSVGSNVFLLQENESTFIPAGTMHRLRNPGKLAVELVEVQCGPYLEEDDIVRLEDDYGRA